MNSSHKEKTMGTRKLFAQTAILALLMEVYYRYDTVIGSH